MAEHEPQHDDSAEPESNKENTKAEVSIEELDDVTGGRTVSHPPPFPPPPTGGE